MSLRWHCCHYYDTAPQIFESVSMSQYGYHKRNELTNGYIHRASIRSDSIQFRSVIRSVAFINAWHAWRTHTLSQSLFHSPVQRSVQCNSSIEHNWINTHCRTHWQLRLDTHHLTCIITSASADLATWRLGERQGSEPKTMIRKGDINRTRLRNRDIWTAQQLQNQEEGDAQQRAKQEHESTKNWRNSSNRNNNTEPGSEQHGTAKKKFNLASSSSSTAIGRHDACQRTWYSRRGATYNH